MLLTLNWVHQGTLFLGPATFTLEGRRTAGGDPGRIYRSYTGPVLTASEVAVGATTGGLSA